MRNREILENYCLSQGCDQNFNGLRCVHLIKQIGVVISSDQYEQHHHKTNTRPSRPPQTASGQTAALANQLSENQRGQQD